MAKKPIPTPEELRQLLRYEPETGKLFWLPREPWRFEVRCTSATSVCTHWNARYAGREAFTSTSAQGYKQGGILRHQLSAHRVIWALVHGHWPKGMIDHINGVRTDNRLANLRVVSDAENSRNSAIRSDNTSGRTGVHWNRSQRKWEAYINSSHGRVRLGKFTDRDAAVSARAAAEKELGYLNNHRRSA